MSNHPHVSVIVPFYNLEECAQDCLESLLSQTASDYEVICVDDGSADSTGHLLDALAADEKRLRVLHIEHSGLSVARNAGVAAAKGELVSFVDGDDLVSPWYLDCLLEAWEEGRDLLVCAGSVSGSHRFLLERHWEPPQQVSTVRLTSEEALRRFLLMRLGQASWASLARRDLYLREPFAPGIVFEDVEARPRHLCAVEGVAVVEHVVYGYVSRKGSLTRSRRVTEEHVIGLLLEVDTIRRLSCGWPEDLVEIAQWRLALARVGALAMACRLDDRVVGRRWAQTLRKGVLRDLPKSLSLCRAHGLPASRMAQIVIAASVPSLYGVARTAFHAYLDARAVLRAWNDEGYVCP